MPFENPDGVATLFLCRTILELVNVQRGLSLFSASIPWRRCSLWFSLSLSFLSRVYLCLLGFHLILCRLQAGLVQNLPIKRVTDCRKTIVSNAVSTESYVLKPSVLLDGF